MLLEMWSPDSHWSKKCSLRIHGGKKKTQNNNYYRNYEYLSWKALQRGVSESLTRAQRHLQNQEYEREWKQRVRGVEGKNWIRCHSGREQEASDRSR
ncbi:hypothetical protein CapIbe_018473 [Capra ibex]